MVRIKGRQTDRSSSAHNAGDSKCRTGGTGAVYIAGGSGVVARAHAGAERDERQAAGGDARLANSADAGWSTGNQSQRKSAHVRRRFNAAGRREPAARCQSTSSAWR